jgi:hypothetical protein
MKFTAAIVLASLSLSAPAFAQHHGGGGWHGGGGGWHGGGGPGWHGGGGFGPGAAIAGGLLGLGIAGAGAGYYYSGGYGYPYYYGRQCYWAQDPYYGPVQVCR